MITQDSATAVIRSSIKRSNKLDHAYFFTVPMPREFVQAAVDHINRDCEITRETCWLANGTFGGGGFQVVCSQPDQDAVERKLTVYLEEKLRVQR